MVQFYLFKSHQQVLVSSWVLMVSTARSRGVPEGEGGRWGEPKNLEIQDCLNKSNRVKKRDRELALTGPTKAL